VIRLSSFGDILCTGPAVRGIRARFPDAEITYITNPPYREIAAALPGVDHVITIERRGEPFERSLDQLELEDPFDKVADLQGSPKSDKIAQLLGTPDVRTDRPPRLRRALLIGARIRLGQFQPVPERMIHALEPWGVEDDGGSLGIAIPPEVFEGVAEKWTTALDGAYVLIPGAKHATKRWPGEYWAELLDHLDTARPVVVLGAQNEAPAELIEAGRNRPKFFELTGQTGLLEAAALLQKAYLAISGDTGPMHLAVAVGVPLVTMFGPTVREFGFFPFRGERVEVLERDLWCRPCSAHGSKRCPLGHHRCMREITASMVWGAVVRVEAGARPNSIK